jgi:hypothetical protein
VLPGLEQGPPSPTRPTISASGSQGPGGGGGGGGTQPSGGGTGGGGGVLQASPSRYARHSWSALLSMRARPSRTARSSAARFGSTTAAPPNAPSDRTETGDCSAALTRRSAQLFASVTNGPT